MTVLSYKFSGPRQDQTRYVDNLVIGEAAGNPAEDGFSVHVPRGDLEVAYAVMMFCYCF